ncbi:hypothetical protein [Occultella glacieicola]|uniref:hypothetical protein n=1 Tax=Occultella glacieicola TaxID=2518684 RepID=UPI0014049C6F|nr:hypothetical protein [Occultella glacieicola]
MITDQGQFGKRFPTVLGKGPDVIAAGDTGDGGNIGPARPWLISRTRDITTT